MGWLFWAGAAVLAVVAIARLARRRSRQRELMLLCHRAGVSFMPIDPFPDTLWLPFGWLGLGRWIAAENVVWNGADGEAARAFDLITEERPAGEDAQPTQHRFTCASVALPFGCPRLQIEPRDALDGVIDVLTGEDIALELEAFNRRFHVRGNDRRFAVAFCDQRMMQALLALPRRGERRGQRGSDAAALRDPPSRPGPAAPGGRAGDRPAGPAGRGEPLSTASRQGSARGPLAAGSLVTRAHR